MRSEDIHLIGDDGNSSPRDFRSKRSPYRSYFVIAAVVVVVSVFVVVLVFLFNAPTSSPSPESDLVSQETIQGVGMIVSTTLGRNSTSLYDRIAWVCDTYGPRFSGSQALEDAITGLGQKIVEDGFEIEEEPVMVPKWVRGEEYVTMLEPRMRKLSILGLGQSNSTYKADGTKGPIQGEVIAVKSWADLEDKKEQVKDKIVLLNVAWVSYRATAEYRRLGAVKAAAFGAIGVLLRSVTPFSMQTPHTGSSTTAPIAAAAVTVEDALQMQRMIDRGQKVVVEMLVDFTQFPDSPSRNLIVKYPGTKFPDEYVILSGHIDSWDIAEGAMDDIGGALLGWEAIRLLKEANLKPDRTILVVMFTNEENGLRGAQQFASNHQNISDKISLALESDSGPFLSYGLNVNASDAAIAILRAAGQIVFGVTNAQGRRLPGSVITQSAELGPDVGELSKFGVPTGFMSPIDVLASQGGPCRDVLADSGVSLTSYAATQYPGYFWYHHTTADTIDKLDPRDLQQSAASLAVWAYTVANLPMLLPQQP